MCKKYIWTAVWVCWGILFFAEYTADAQTTDDIMFIHHSSGQNWLDSGLRDALAAKSYIDEVNEITYSTVLSPDAGRPDSLGSVPGDNTNMNHWILWFNDYLNGIKTYDCATGSNEIILFKSCFPISNITGDGTEPGNPFLDTQTLANYRAVYRHPSGSGNTYLEGGVTYKPLEDIFAENPGVLFIIITAPSNVPSQTNNTMADRARTFNNWLKNDWLSNYNASHTGLRNVAVFDWFDTLTYPSDDARTESYDPIGPQVYGTYPVRNMTKFEYRESASDSHPNTTANQYSTTVFATNTPNFIDTAYNTWQSPPSSPTPTPVPTPVFASNWVMYE